MKKGIPGNCSPLGRVELLLVVAMLFGLAAAPTGRARAQSGPEPPDSVVAIVADAQGLPFVPPDQRPQRGTYWEVRAWFPSLPTPSPCPPRDTNTPVYAICERHFLVDQTGGQLLAPQAGPYARRALGTDDPAAVLQAEADALQAFVTQVQARQLAAQSALNNRMSAPALESPQPDSPQPNGLQPPPPCGTNSIYDVWITDPAAGWVTNQGWTVSFTIAGGTNGAVYDVFGTCALSNTVADSYWVWLTNGHACDQITLTNQWPRGGFYVLGTPLNSDHGALPDAWELLITHGNTNDPTDDRLVPLVGVSAVDSVAVEQDAANTASFLITRLGGRLNLPLTVGCQLSGTAVRGVNYTLAPVTSTATNVLVTIPAGQTSVLLTLTPLEDHVTDGTKTAALTLMTNVAPCELDPARTSATAYILEEYSHTYTTVGDFTEGVRDGLEAAAPAPDGQLQFKTDLPAQFPFINVACSGRGTAARINTTNGLVMGEYLTAPPNLTFTGDDGPGPQPSRTTVDQYGNVWVANRDDTRMIGGRAYGSITRIGLILGGSRFDKIGTNYMANPQGQYVALSNATYNTCLDRDGDGYIRTSAGLADILPWTNDGDVDSNGGVSTAEDEAITEYTRVLSTGTRTIAVDKFNDIWVGGRNGNRTHLKVNGLTGTPVPNSAFDPKAGGYGGVIDSLGVLWSSPGPQDLWATEGLSVLRLVPPASLPVQSGDWQALLFGSFDLDYFFYGIAVDPVHPYIWQSTAGDPPYLPSVVFRWSTNGAAVTTNGVLQTFEHGGAQAQGLAVDTQGHVWVAHQKDVSHTVGHLNTNGTLVGVVELQVRGLWAEYFTNTTLAGVPALTNVEGPVDFDSASGWPGSPVAADPFSARWSGIVAPEAGGEHVFYVSAEAGAAFRLTVNGALLIDNWTSPASDPVELAGTNWLGTNVAYDVRLEYAHLTNGAQVKLSWMEPGTAKQVIPPERFQSLTGNGINSAVGATGISVDAAGKIWAGCYNSSTAVRIDPEAGPMVQADGQIEHVGLVDMVVDLGSQAHPYNYSDMTGFNGRVVNPGLKPLKGYWEAIDDSGRTNEFWQRVSWSADLPGGCSVEAYVRAADDRAELARATFVAASNSGIISGVYGRFIEVRLAMTRDDASKQPVIYDLTLHGQTSSYDSGGWLDDQPAYETQNATFSPYRIVAPEPLAYQWHVQYPWMNEWDWMPVVGATNSEFTISNVDSWVGGYLDSDGVFHCTRTCVFVTDAAGEGLWLGPAYLDVWPSLVAIPNTGTLGPASRYPATIGVFGQPTSVNSVAVALFGLSHGHPGDLAFLLVSPSGTNVMLMSHVGGSTNVADADLVFQQSGFAPPISGPIPSGRTSYYMPTDYGHINPMPQVGADPPPPGPYSTSLDDLIGTNPNGMWKLYIYDDHSGAIGQLAGSSSQGTWQLRLDR